MSTTLTSVRTVAVSVALLLGAAGCSSTSDSDTSTSAVSTAGASNSSSAASSTSASGSTSSSSASGSSSASESSSSSASAKPPKLPKMPSAGEERLEGGAAYAAYVFDVVNFAWTEPEAGAIASLKRGDCEFCDKLEDHAGVLSASQRRFESDPFTLDKPIALKAKNTFKVLGKANKVDIVDKDDKTVSTQAASGVAFTLTVKWSGKRWMLDSLTQG